MAKGSAFGTSLGMGTLQVESTPIVGTIANPGNATVTITKTGMTGSPLAVNVAVLSGDLPAATAVKMADALNATANFAARCFAYVVGSTLYVRALTAAANDAGMNIAYTNGTCTGLTPDATSDDTTAGGAPATIAYVNSIGGPGLSVDTVDVTTHDSSGGWEEQVPTILRDGEVRVELEFDPAQATHQATSVGGLGYVYKNKLLKAFVITFPDTTAWSFSAYVTSWEPNAPVDGALTATATLKITGVPILV